jgi:drug/metabolite transporter (DMT)-like permease
MTAATPDHPHVRGTTVRAGWLAALSSGALWGLSGVLVGLALGMSPYAAAGSALLAAVACSTINECVRLCWQLGQDAATGRLRRLAGALRSRPGRLACVAGIFGGPIATVCLYVAYQYAGVAYAYAITALSPAIGALLGLAFLGDRLARRAWLGIVLSVGGAALATYRPPAGAHPHFALGVVFALVCALGYGIEPIFAAGALHVLDAALVNTLRMGTSFTVLALVVLPLLGGYPLLAAALTSRSVLWIAVAGVLSSSGYLLFFLAVDGLGPGRAMPVNLTYVLWAALFGLVILHARPGWGLLLGALVSITGAALVVSGGGRRSEEPVTALGAGA